MMLIRLIDAYLAALAAYEATGGYPARDPFRQTECRLADALFLTGPVSHEGWIYIYDEDDSRPYVTRFEESAVRPAEGIEVPEEEQTA